MLKNHDLHPAFIFLTGILIVFLLISSVSAIFSIKNKINQESDNTITVSDKGEIYAKPDLAIIDLSVVTEAETVAEAMTQNTGKMDAIVVAIKNQGVSADDLKTTIFNIYPRYEYGNDKRALMGYEVHQTLQVKVRELQKISQIVQQATDAGVNQVGNLQFTVDNQDDLKKQARQEAIKKAKIKAAELAKQLGVKLVRITDFNEGSEISVPVYQEMAYAGKGGIGGASIESGQNKIEVIVNITYDIK